MLALYLPCPAVGKRGLFSPAGLCVRLLCSGASAHEWGFVSAWPAPLTGTAAEDKEGRSLRTTNQQAAQQVF